MKSLEYIDFEKLIAKETNARMCIRLLALGYIKEGANRTQTAKFLKLLVEALMIGYVVSIVMDSKEKR